jgi:hypothetical protein
MRLLLSAAMAVAIASSAPARAAELDDKSLAPAWVQASADERAAWLAKMKDKHPATDSDAMAKCLDENTKWPAVATNLLSGVSSLCTTIIERGG